MCITLTLVFCYRRKVLAAMTMDMAKSEPITAAANQSNSPHQLCAGCGKQIQDRYLLRALDMLWHEDCLKCGCCDCRLGEVGSTLYTKGNLMLCKRDYLRWEICIEIDLCSIYDVFGEMLVTILPSTSPCIYVYEASIESHEMVSGLGGLVGSYLYVCYDLYSKHHGIIFGVFVHFADYLAIRDYAQPVTKSFRHLKWWWGQEVMFIIWSALRANNVIIGKLSMLYVTYMEMYSARPIYTGLTPQEVKFDKVTHLEIFIVNQWIQFKYIWFEIFNIFFTLPTF